MLGGGGRGSPFGVVQRRQFRFKSEFRTANGLSITLRYDRQGMNVTELTDGTTKTTTYYNP